MPVYMIKKPANITQIARFMGLTWGPPGFCRLQMVPMIAPWTLLSYDGTDDDYIPPIRSALSS